MNLNSKLDKIISKIVIPKDQGSMEYQVSINSQWDKEVNISIIHNNYGTTSIGDSSNWGGQTKNFQNKNKAIAFIKSSLKERIMFIKNLEKEAIKKIDKYEDSFKDMLKDKGIDFKEK